MICDVWLQARDDNLTTPMTLPYFEGDFWPGVIEDCIRETTNEEAERKRAEVEAQAADMDDDDDDDIFSTGDHGKKKNR